MTTQAVLQLKRVRYRMRSAVTRILCPVASVFFLAVGILLIGTGLTSAGRSQDLPDPLAFGLGAFVTVVGLAYGVPVFWPVLELTTHTLRRSRVLRRAQIIPLEELTGIGLVYKRLAGAPAPLGWFMYLWTTGDIPRDVGIGYQPARWLYPASKIRQKFLAIEPSAAELRRPFDRYHFSYNFRPVTQTDPDKLAATYAGRVAREIYDRVLEYQGPSGLLATRQDQKHVPVPGAHLAYSSLVARPLSSAYWSPDGELGHVTTKAQPHESVPPGKARPRSRRPGLLLQLRHLVRLAGRTLR